jgi:hypothetical protein
MVSAGQSVTVILLIWTVTVGLTVSFVITHRLSWVRRGVTMYQGLMAMLPHMGTVLYVAD